VNNANITLDLRQLMAKALTECATIAEAVALVEKVQAIMGGALHPPAPAPALVSAPTPVSPFTPEKRKRGRPRTRPVVVAPAERGPRTKIKPPMGQRTWTEADAKQANTMLALHRPMDDIATVMKRTEKAIAMAVQRGILLVPPDYPHRRGGNPPRQVNHAEMPAVVTEVGPDDVRAAIEGMTF
jgi:hypothetical protein